MSQRPASEGDNDPLPTPQTPIYVVRLDSSTPNSPAAVFAADAGHSPRHESPVAGFDGATAVGSSPPYPRVMQGEGGVDQGSEEAVEGLDIARPVLPVSGPL